MRVARPSFPKTLRQFQSDFATEEACQQYLAACRWPDGFICPRCGHGRAYELVKQQRQQCVKCRHQVSLTSGTILHRTKTSLTHWFWAAYLMTTDKRGVSALLLQRQLGLSRYETAWMMLHKLRRAMVNVIRDFKAATIIPFLTKNIAPGSTIYTDGLKSFADLAEAGFKHVARNQPLRSELRKGTKSAVPLAESGHWEPPAMADRHLPRSEQGPTPGLSRRIRLSA